MIYFLHERGQEKEKSVEGLFQECWHKNSFLHPKF